MGLHTSHGCFSGSYASFHMFRLAVAKAAGYPIAFTAPGLTYLLPQDMLGDIDQTSLGHWDAVPKDPLMILMAHSDCDGVIHHEHASALADALLNLHDKIHANWLDNLESFIRGLRLAAQRKENVVFL